MLRTLRLACLLVVLPLSAFGQDRAQTLADIRAELSALSAEFNALKQELVTTGAAASGAAGGDALMRMDAIEAQLMALTGRAEAIELRLNAVVTDGTRRVNDLEFRVCELTEGCDIAALAAAQPLGGGATTTGGAAVPATPTEPAAPVTGGPELAVGEQADFDRAREVLGQGDFRAAADLFATFTQSYPGGPLTQEAHVLRGDALSQLGDTTGSAKAYLDGFSGQPSGPKAAEALLKLGQSLGTLGQTVEACVTLQEVSARFPATPEAASATVAMQGLGCS